MTRFTLAYAVAFLALLAFGCAKRVDTASAVATEAHAEQASAGEVRVLEHGTRSAGPVDVVTVTEVFEKADDSGNASGASVASPAPLSRLSLPSASPTVPRAPALIKRITRTEHRGPVEATRDRATQAEAATAATQDAHATAQSTGTTASGWSPPWWLWLACLALGAGILYWRLR